MWIPGSFIPSHPLRLPAIRLCTPSSCAPNPVGRHTTTSLLPKTSTYGEFHGVLTKIACCLQAAERTDSSFRPGLKIDEWYPTTIVALRLGKRALTIYQRRSLSTYSSDIIYRAYVPYDDPSGRDLLTHFSEFSLQQFPTLQIFFATYGTPILVI